MAPRVPAPSVPAPGLPDGPVRIEPRWVERVWGRRILAPWGNDAGEAPLGEAWLSDLSCTVEGGGTFGDLVARDPAAALGSAAEQPPILVKLLFTAEALSVQVHPTDEAARAGHLGPFGKNEAWHILQAEPDAAVWIGFEPGATRAAVAAAVADGSVLGLMHRRPVRAGDTVPVPAGTVHAIGPGIVLLEVQDPVQVTYRLFDHGRARPLQVEEAMAVAAFTPAAGFASAVPEPPVLVEAPRFVLERHRLGRELRLRPDGTRSHLLVPLTPGALLDGRPLPQGSTAFVPARGRPVALGTEAGTDAELAVVHPGPGATPCLLTGGERQDPAEAAPR